MFSEPPPEESLSSLSELSDVVFPNEDTFEENGDDTEVSKAMKALKSENQLETTKMVEKISVIVSPYFVVLVGLILYEDNFLFGSILIITGILTLLKVTWADINRFIAKIKASLNSPDDSGTF